MLLPQENVPLGFQIALHLNIIQVVDDHIKMKISNILIHMNDNNGTDPLNQNYYVL